MDIRTAEPADTPAVRDVARRSLQASYSLGPKAITSAIEEWYGEERLDEIVTDEDHQLILAEVDGQVVGFSESTLAGEGIGTLLWLHVDPAFRGREIASSLFDETHARLTDIGADQIQARVLADNPDGNAFYQDKGFQKTAEDTIEIEGRTYVENVYVGPRASGREPIDQDGETVYVDHDVTERGSADAFHVVYAEEDGEDLYGYYCANCETLANAMDAMGRIECDQCGNARRPTRWDSVYL